MNQSKPQHEPATNPARAFRTLIVDDNAGSAKVLGLLFRKLQQPDIELAHSGSDAIAKAKASHPEIIILDIVLGDMTGIDVIKVLKDLPDFQQTLFVALTGNDSVDDRQRTKEVGFDLHLAKPAGVSDIKQIINCRENLR